MTDTSTNNTRIAKNTIVLYFRMMIILFVNLYISRVVLNTLGVEDYGIYNVVGGFVTMFSLISGALSNAISRFVTFELGRGDFNRLRKVFSTSVNVQFLISLIICLLLETIGLWFLNYKMVIPDDRMIASNWVLQCSIITFVINLISVPYNASIIAHERMTAYAYISILEVFLKLCCVFLLYLDISDKLIAYSIMIASVALVIRIVYGYYCTRQFSECKYFPIIDKPLLKEMTSMASWNILGSGASVLNQQGVNLLINLFFGVSVNAARGIATQVSAAISSFVSSFTTAINPQITKKYAQGNIDEMSSLVFRGARFSYYIMYFLVLPIFLETPLILKLWLKIVPDYSVVFVRLTLLASLVSVLTTGLFTVSMATGNIKRYQTVVGCLALSIFVLTYFSFKIGLPVESTYVILVIVEIVIMLARIIIVNKQVKFGSLKYLKDVVLNVLLFSIVSAIIPCMVHIYLSHSLYSSIIVILTSFIVCTIVTLTVGMNKDERKRVNQILKNKFHSL